MAVGAKINVEGIPDTGSDVRDPWTFPVSTIACHLFV